ncbi:unnamed protein product [Schistocephalus solidus]|uniref:Glutamate decarboxylase n=1 Tax=Schistocephalus solidus TaxID=70667 RepID=A0A183SBG1_SCHSO|nr:unnamed protein product [Schistocephalus solidus]
MGPHGLIGFNDNGLLLKSTCAEQCVILTNTFFCLSMRQKVIWMPPSVGTGTYWILSSSGELVNRLVNLPAAKVDASMENCWCQLWDTVQSNALDVLSHALHQHLDAAINTLLAEKNRLHKAYVNHRYTENKTTYYLSYRLV